MLRVNPWLIGTIIVLFIFWYIFVPSDDDTKEFFNDIKPRKHAIFNKCGNLLYFLMEHPDQCVDGCHKIECPSYIDSKITCWETK
jgi:hypothetical protein